MPTSSNTSSASNSGDEAQATESLCKNQMHLDGLSLSTRNAMCQKKGLAGTKPRMMGWFSLNQCIKEMLPDFTFHGFDAWWLMTHAKMANSRDKIARRPGWVESHTDG